jgi:phosphatidylinositol dimannoside acyltransferase
VKTEVEVPALPEPDESASERLAYWMIRGTEWIGMHVPRPVGLWLAGIYLRARYERMHRERETVAANLARVLGGSPEDDIVMAATREAFALYGRYWYDTFALRSMSSDEVRRRFRPRGVEHIEAGLAAGRGVILALPHIGNWDAAGHWLALNGYPLVAVAEELRPKRVYDLFYRHRRALGMDIVPLSSGVGEQLARMLGDNRIVALLADRNLGGRGVRVPFFGEEAALPAGPAFLARATGAALLPSAAFTTPDGWSCVVEPPIDVPTGGRTRDDVEAATTEIAWRFERFISAAPTDWHMFQPVWDEPPPPAEGVAT